MNECINKTHSRYSSQISGMATGLIAGVDEVGRGPLAGPVVAAAVILDDENMISGLVDSKKLSINRRESLAGEIREKALAWAVARVEHNEIDKINILQASLLAMRYAVNELRVSPHCVLVDGNQVPDVAFPVQAVIKGDQSIPAISAASILAKVVRDQEMVTMDAQYPGYGFAQHKGYPTKQHLDALSRLGVCAIHRRSYAPVRRYL